ncbi:MAG: hypothetical protein LBJ99_01690, partial [Oscillospiraceae bacterium]|nr:hypothetical protein [Oscillospiraceae bacterium]
PEIRGIVESLPSPAELAGQMADAGCKTALEEIGLRGSIRGDSLMLSPFVRARLTLQRLSGLLRGRDAEV